MRWLPIETAPEDATPILVFDPTYGQQSVAWWSETEGQKYSSETNEYYGGGQWIDGTVADWGNEEYRWLRPTHWMPLPDPPP